MTADASQPPCADSTASCAQPLGPTNEQILRFVLPEICTSEAGRMALIRLLDLLQYVGVSLAHAADALEFKTGDRDAAIRWLWNLVAHLNTAQEIMADALAPSADQGSAH